MSANEKRWLPAVFDLQAVRTPPRPHLGTFVPIGTNRLAIREWIPANDTDPQAVFAKDIVSTHWVPNLNPPRRRSHPDP